MLNGRNREWDSRDTAGYLQGSYRNRPIHVEFPQTLQQKRFTGNIYIYVY